MAIRPLAGDRSGRLTRTNCRMADSDNGKTNTMNMATDNGKTNTMNMASDQAQYPTLHPKL
jgi:hypothetical protein